MGFLLGAVSLYFVIPSITEQLQHSNLNYLDNKIFLVLILLVIIYGITNLILGVIWWEILRGIKVYEKKWKIIRIYGLSQISKYIPGNIFHLVGRQYHSFKNNLPSKNITQSIFYELLISAITGSLFGIILLPYYSKNITSFSSLFLYFFIIGLLLYLSKKIFNSHISQAIILQTIYQIIVGIIFVIIIYSLNPYYQVAIYNVIILISIYVVSWLVGFMTPGSPAGLGVRELCLLTLGQNIMPEINFGIAILVSRSITICGDLLFFLFSFLMKK